MTAALRALAMAGVIALLVFAGLRISGLMQAERYAASEPEQALEARPDDPRALLALAERQLQDGDAAAAAASARHLLAHEPLEGRAFRVLGAVAHREGRTRDALHSYLVAARRAPRDIPTRAWLVEHYLERGDYPKALAHIDYVLRTTPGRTKAITRILREVAPMVQDDAFAVALADLLSTDPPWRTAMLAAIGAYPDGASRVIERLQRRGALLPDEYAKWLGGLMAGGRWGEAFARWAGHAIKPGEPIPLLYNGDFAQPPSGVGFDWQMQEAAGVLGGYEATPAGGGVCRLRFLDEEVDRAGLRHPLLLFPGAYRLTARARGQGLQGLEGVRWRVECAGKAGVIARGEPLHGDFEWRSHTIDFVVPAERCPGQWLVLANASEKQGLRRLAGDLWVDDVKVSRLPARSEPASGRADDGLAIDARAQ